MKSIYYLPPWVVIVVLAFSFWCGCLTSGESIASVDPCDLSVSPASPESPFDFAGLGEDATACLMTSWRDYFVESSPDANAVFVTTSCGEGAQEDGSLDHPFCTIDSALAKIAQESHFTEVDPPTLYLEPGSHAMEMNIKEELPRLGVRGLCSETTTLTADDGESPLFSVGTTGQSLFLSLKNVSIVAGNAAAISIVSGEVQVEGIAIEPGASGACIEVSGSSSVLTARTIIVDGSPSASLDSSTESGGSESVIMPIVGSRDIPTCIRVVNGGRAAIENFSIEDMEGVAILVGGAGSAVDLVDGIVSRTHEIGDDTPDDDTDDSPYENMYGYGLAVDTGGSATLQNVTFSENAWVNVIADGDASTVTVQNSFMASARSAPASVRTGVGILVQRGATAALHATTFQDNEAPGLYVSNGASVTVTDSTFENNGFAGAVVVDADTTIEDSLFLAQSFHSSSGGDIGVFMWHLSEGSSLSATIQRNLFEGQVYSLYALYLYGLQEGDGDVVLRVDRNRIRSAEMNGAILISFEGEAALTDNCFENSTWDHLLIDSCTATVSGNSYDSAHGDFAIRQQRCGSVSAMDVTDENLQPSSDVCLCGVVTPGGSACGAYPMGPTVDHDFLLGEVVPIE